MGAAPDEGGLKGPAPGPTAPGRGAGQQQRHQARAVRQELEESQAFLVQLAGRHKDCAATPEQLAVKQGQAETRRRQHHDDALGIAGRLGPALLHGAKDGRQGHGIMGMYFIHFLGILSFER
jgi:hypothetical protein